MKQSPNTIRDMKFTRTVLLNEETLPIYDKLTSKSNTVREMLLAAKELEHPDEINNILRKLQKDAADKK